MNQGNNELTNSELVIALAYAVGTDNKLVISIMKEKLKEFGYESVVIKISKELIEPTLDKAALSGCKSYERTTKLMDRGNQIREESGANYILACGVASLIHKMRGGENHNEPLQNTAIIIDSLKHPQEADKLMEIYPSGFYLFAVNESEADRIQYLSDEKNMGRHDACTLVQRDMDEHGQSHGQHTRQVFEMADFHLSATIHSESQDKKAEKKRILQLQISRIFDLIFGNPFLTPTFDEYAMFMAYTSGLRSADLSRQVGAVITLGNDIVATGANDVPQFGGGQYWPDSEYQDVKDGRDYKRGYDSNKIELAKIVDKIMESFEFTELENVEENKRKTKTEFMNLIFKDMTEFGRPVHAEMAALMSCARNGVSPKGATLYCSTFPCHNCAKHIIAAGIERVVYIEPYPKSRTLELYSDSITLFGEDKKVKFNEFVGIGPRRFYDLFSMRLSTGRCVSRKNKETHCCVEWTQKTARVRCQMLSLSYIDKEMMEDVKWIGRKKGES